MGGVRLADGTAPSVAGYSGCEKGSHFAGLARYGHAKSEYRYIWGVRLVLLTDERGLPLGYTVVPANEHEREPLADLLSGTPADVVVADKGFWGESFRKRLAADGVRLLTPDKTRTSANLAFERTLASTRLVIESVFSNLKGQMQLERQLARPSHSISVVLGSRPSTRRLNAEEAKTRKGTQLLPVIVAARACRVAGGTALQLLILRLRQDAREQSCFKRWSWAARWWEESWSKWWSAQT